MPDAFVRAVAPASLPAPGRYGVAVCFLPRDQARRDEIERRLEEIVHAEGQRVLGWRDVPVDTEHVGTTAGAAAPVIRHLFVGAAGEIEPGLPFERKLYVIRRVAERTCGSGALDPLAVSARTLVYKGMLTAPQLPDYFPDLRDERMVTRLALVHSRFSTNTFPSWPLAHPYRMLAHNGEINTLRGNVNWMRARESQLASDALRGGPGQDPADRLAGRVGLGHARQRARAAHPRRPRAPARDDDDDPRGLRGSRRRPRGRAGLLRLPLLPDGAVGRPGRRGLHRRPLRRRHARPQRAAPGPLAADARRLRRARLGDRRPARRARGRRAQGPPAARAAVPRRPRGGPDRPRRRGQALGGLPRSPYADWFAEHTITLDDLDGARSAGAARRAAAGQAARLRLHPGGPAARDRADGRPRARSPSPRWATTPRWPSCPTASRCSSRYFKQLFAQVTNPPVDPIRESVVMCLRSGVGGERQPARGDARARPPARAPAADPAQQAPREAAPGPTTSSSWRARSTPPGPSRRGRRAWSAASTPSAPRPRSPSTRARTS